MDLDPLQETLSRLQQWYGDRTDFDGAPLWWHPVRVALRVAPVADLTELQAALLHETVQLGFKTLHELRCLGYDDRVRESVAVLTESHLRGRTYLEWLDTIARRDNQSCLRVQLADLTDILQQYGLAQGKEQEKMLARCQRGLRYLLQQRLVGEVYAPLVQDVIASDTLQERLAACALFSGCSIETSAHQ